MPAANDLPVEYAAFGGRQVGRIPANLCRSFCFLQNRGLVLGNISVMYVGEVGQSTRPPVHIRFRRGGQGHLHQAGGLAELEALYHLVLPQNRLRECMRIIEDNHERGDLDRFAV